MTVSSESLRAIDGRAPQEGFRSFSERFAEYSRTLDCVHCGLCIQSCPTYDLTGREADSPRGRIYLMRGYAEGRGALTDAVRSHLDRCIVCRACESVCPSGIRMGEMMEGFRAELEKQRTRRPWRYRLARFLLREVLPHRRRIAWMSDLLWFYQWTRMRTLVARVVARISPRLARLHSMQPEVPHPRVRRLEASDRLPGGVHAAAGARRARVGLFLGCVASEWFAPTLRATIRVLQANGCEVVVPSRQTCCGALHRHGGFVDDAGALFATNARAFTEACVDVIVVAAAGCGAALEEPAPPARAGLGAPVRDICEFLDEIGIVSPPTPVPLRVAYDQPCHLQHGQKIGADVVVRLLSRVPALELVPLADSDRCCGSGGVYNLLQPAMADRLRDEKVASVIASGANTVVTGNPGCAMQIACGLRAVGGDAARIAVLHPVELLDRGYAS